MTKYGMIIDISRCTACYCCFAACKDEYWENDYLPYTAAQPRYGQFWMNIEKKERGKYPYVKAAYMPVPCMQCQSAPCIDAAEDNAVYRRDDGIIVIDPEKAVGQKKIFEACPYGAIYWNEDKNLPQKCTFCVHRIEEGKTPRCAQACPSHAIKFGDLDDPDSEVSRLLNSDTTDILHPEYETSPLVRYVDLYQMNTLFIAGAAVFADTDECAEGVDVSLTGNGVNMKTFTNNYGSFEFDGLAAGVYRLDFTIDNYAPKSLDVQIEEEVYIPAIMLERR
ncbi:MAG: carboxypeptidase regulatory-like domain-containing protein [Desulfobacteraceae bacterium]|nr:carboxypeptidase regulatory-like domain-containing protein [Desulfobacteraceae bacterium]MCF8094053.1 carboxypeptidase regulatory-like domain-containing protein [Desulfobacteraceae bacterium]